MLVSPTLRLHKLETAKSNGIGLALSVQYLSAVLSAGRHKPCLVTVCPQNEIPK